MPRKAFTIVWLGTGLLKGSLFLFEFDIHAFMWTSWKYDLPPTRKQEKEEGFKADAHCKEVSWQTEWARTEIIRLVSCSSSSWLFKKCKSDEVQDVWKLQTASMCVYIQFYFWYILLVTHLCFDWGNWVFSHFRYVNLNKGSEYCISLIQSSSLQQCIAIDMY